MTAFTRQFSIRLKIVLIVLVAGIVLIAAMYAVGRVIIFKGYLTIERDSIVRNVEQVQGAIDGVRENLAVKIGDWATWDDAYQFVSGAHPTFAETDVTPLALVNLNINTMAYVNASGTIMLSESIDLSTGNEIRDPTVESFIAANPDLLAAVIAGSSTSGMIDADGKPIVVALYPIRRSDGSGPIAGAIVFAQYVNEQLVRELQDKTRTKFEILSRSKSPDARALHERIGANPVLVEAVSESVIAGSAIITDLKANPAFIVRIERDRTLYNQAEATFKVFLILAGTSVFIVGGTILLLLEYFFVARLARLEQELSRIGESYDEYRRVQEGPLDELGKLARAVNRMLDAAASAELMEREATRKVLRANEGMEQKLAEIERMNKLMIDRETKMIELKKENDALRAKKG